MGDLWWFDFSSVSVAAGLPPVDDEPVVES